MQKSLLAQLREMTVVVADTGDIQAIEKFRPQDATTNPSLITTAAQMPEYQQIVDDVLLGAKQDLGKDAKNADVTRLAFERLAIAFGKKILGIIKGRVSTEVDARLSYDTGKTLATARSIIDQYEKAGISRERVLIKIASTWKGIKAAEELEKEGIHFLDEGIPHITEKVRQTRMRIRDLADPLIHAAIPGLRGHDPGDEAVCSNGLAYVVDGRKLHGDALTFPVSRLNFVEREP
jgi:hypothetical protein